LENRLTYQYSAGCHHNEEEISRHFKLKKGYWPVQMNGNKFATGQILQETGRSCEGADFSWLSAKVSRTLVDPPKNTGIFAFKWWCGKLEGFTSPPSRS
jgi:hypothetical protein